jgi:hypothetical protein
VSAPGYDGTAVDDFAVEAATSHSAFFRSSGFREAVLYPPSKDNTARHALTFVGDKEVCRTKAASLHALEDPLGTGQCALTVKQRLG